MHLSHFLQIKQCVTGISCNTKSNFNLGEKYICRKRYICLIHFSEIYFSFSIMSNIASPKNKIYPCSRSIFKCFLTLSDVPYICVLPCGGWIWKGDLIEIKEETLPSKSTKFYTQKRTDYPRILSSKYHSSEGRKILGQQGKMSELMCAPYIRKGNSDILLQNVHVQINYVT